MKMFICMTLAIATLLTANVQRAEASEIAEIVKLKEDPNRKCDLEMRHLIRAISKHYRAANAAAIELGETGISMDKVGAQILKEHGNGDIIAASVADAFYKLGDILLKSSITHVQNLSGTVDNLNDSIKDMDKCLLEIQKAY